MMTATTHSGLEYAIVVPSRRRTRHMPQLLSLLPTAVVCVDEIEMADYGPHVPAAQLWAHPPLASLGAIRQWILDHAGPPAIFMADDDLIDVICLVGRRVRKVTAASRAPATASQTRPTSSGSEAPRNAIHVMSALTVLAPWQRPQRSTRSTRFGSSRAAPWAPGA